MTSFAVIAVGMKIASLNVEKNLKQRINHCTLYNHRKEERVNLYEKLESCKKRILKGHKRRVVNVREGKRAALPFLKNKRGINQ